MSTEPDLNSICLVIPAYNEAGAIGAVLAELSKFPYQVIVVDDGSSDQTPGEAACFPITILRHAVNLGQGAALQTGITYALGHCRCAWLVTFDADGQHDPEDPARLVTALAQSGCQVALGTRFAAGGQALNMPLRKRLTLHLAIAVTRWMTGLPLTDTHNGLRAFRRDAAAKINLRHNGMAHASEILSQIAGLKLSWIEVPVSIRYTEYSRRKGQSILNSINILWDLLMGRIR